QQQKTLHAVASSGNLGMLKQILSVLQDPLKAVNDPHPSTGLTPLHFAASRGHLEVVKCLLEDYAVSVDSRDKEGEVRGKMNHTPLINAASKGYMSIVEYLLDEAHANPLLKNNFGEAAY
ncbi:hypothetical protein PHYBLDRAFT_94736, partial [Phycomyces blakesleeanus NRRL 1555(-)]